MTRVARGRLVARAARVGDAWARLRAMSWRFAWGFDRAMRGVGAWSSDVARAWCARALGHRRDVMMRGVWAQRSREAGGEDFVRGVGRRASSARRRAREGLRRGGARRRFVSLE